MGLMPGCSEVSQAEWRHEIKTPCEFVYMIETSTEIRLPLWKILFNILYYLNSFHVYEEIREMKHLQFPTTFEKSWIDQTFALNVIVEM